MFASLSYNQINLARFGRALLAAGSDGFVIKSTYVEMSSVLGLVRGLLCEPGLTSAG